MRVLVWPHIAQNKPFNYICFCLRILTHWCPPVGKALACNGILEQGLGVGVGRFWPCSRSVLFAAGLIANSNTNMYIVPWTKSSITTVILHNWQHSAVLCLWGKNRWRMNFSNCISRGFRKCFKDVTVCPHMKRPPVDFRYDSIVVWLESVVKEEQHLVEGFPYWTSIYLLIRPFQHPAP